MLHSADAASREAALIKDPRLRVAGIAGEPEWAGPGPWETAAASQQLLWEERKK